ncbi:retrovirus-related pol polyprotein from transposon TNT 1-94 [Tanacetum coccineum]
MEHGLLSQNGSGVGRGVKEKDLNRNKKNTSSGIGVSADSEDTMNDDTPIGVASAVQEGVTSSVVDMKIEMGKHNSLDDTIVPKQSGKKVNVRTLLTPGGNGIDVVVPMDSIRAISARFANTAYGFFLGKKVAYPVIANYVRNTLDAMLENGPWFIRNNSLILKKWLPNENLLKEDVSTVPVWVKLHGGRSSYARVLIELRADVELKDNIIVAMPKITRKGHYTCNVRVEYKWKPPRCSSCKVFGHVHEECTKNTGAGEKKTVKKPSQTSRGVPVGLKMGFKPQREYRPVIKKPNASSNGNKKKGVEPTIEVSNSNPFDVLNSVDNDGEFGTNGGTTNLVNNKATSSGSSFMNIDNDGECASNTPIGAKIDKIERQIGEGKLRLLDSEEA